MKKIFSLAVLTIAILVQNISYAQSPQEGALGLPGDNLDLYSVLDLFQQSPTLESFEQSLNSQDSKINNLDLNGDGKTDYIKVVDHPNGNSHAIALQDVVNQNETHDVAVIEVDKDNNNQVHVQIIGDESLYGKNYIVEPSNDNGQGTPNPGYVGNTTVNNTYVNNNYNTPAVSWPIVSFMFAPAYVPYVSPYYWGYYPTYWNPWRPLGYRAYYNYHRSYYGYYHRAYAYRAPALHTYYGPRRTSSSTFGNRVQSGAFHNNANKSFSRPTYNNQAPRVRSYNSPLQMHSNTNMGGGMHGGGGGMRGGGGGGRRR